MEPVLVAQALNALFAIAVLALVALGLAVVFGLLGVLNLAHGELVMIGAYCAYVVQANGWPFIAAVPLAVVVCGMLGFVVERWLVRPLYQRPFDTLVVTWGLSLLLAQVRRSDVRPRLQEPERAAERHGRHTRRNLPALSAAADRGERRSRSARLVLWYGRSRTGTRIKAMVDNPDLARALGIPVSRFARPPSSPAPAWPAWPAC